MSPDPEDLRLMADELVDGKDLWERVDKLLSPQSGIQIPGTIYVAEIVISAVAGDTKTEIYRELI